MKYLLLSILLVLTCSMPASAVTVTCTNCSDRFLQALERATNIEQLEAIWKTYAEEMMQTQQQIMMVKQNIEQYTNMVKNTIKLPFSIKNTIIRDFKTLANLSQGLKQTVGELDVLDGVYDSYYPSFSGAKKLSNLPSSKINSEYYKFYEKWSDRIDTATKATFKLSGKQLKELSESGELDSHIGKLLTTPEGRMQALQAANQLSAIQISEVRKLRALLATDIQNQAQINQKKEKIEQLQKIHQEKFFKHIYKDQIEQENLPVPSNTF